MRLKFTKMQGLGNDFVVIDGVTRPIQLDAKLTRLIGDRRYGVGCDQILVVHPAVSADNDFRYQIFNGDGTEVEHCGNGARCFLRFVRDEGLTEKREIRVETLGGVIVPRLNPDGKITVNMGIPVFAPDRVPFVPGDAAQVMAHTWRLQVAETAVDLTILALGNPHAVQLVDDVDQAPVASLGPAIETHPAFPRGVNAGFLQVLDRRRARLRVFERGAGETLACGSGACAALVTGVIREVLDSEVRISARGGDLLLRWDGPGSPVWLTGEAVPVFRGEIELPDPQFH